VYQDITEYLESEPYIDAFEITPACVDLDDLEGFFADLQGVYIIETLVCSAKFMNDIL
jgi:hypothetical protein